MTSLRLLSFETTIEIANCVCLIISYCASCYRQCNLYFQTTLYFSEIKANQVALLYGKSIEVKNKVTEKSTSNNVLPTEKKVK